MSKRFLILVALIMAAILVSGCCCCTSDRSLYGPASSTIRPSATVIKVTVVPAKNVTPLPSPTVLVVTP